MLGFLFFLVMRLVEYVGIGIGWKMIIMLEDLDFVDDLVFILSIFT